jgi:DNA integrity scanning protein DisA with diadenylate cyclase activity
MKPLSISRLIFDTIPQIYEATKGPHPIDLRINGEEARVYALAPLTPALRTYLDRASVIWEDLRPMTEGEISQIIEREWIQQKFVVDWLQTRTRIQSWGRILDYVRRLSRRLTENQALAKTIVVEPGRSEPGCLKISDPDYFKVFDWLGTSQYTHFRVKEDLGIQVFDALPSADPQGQQGFRFYPDWLHPVISSLKGPDDVVVHLADNDSIFVADRNGLLASKRALESWTIYDIEHIMDSVGQAMKGKMQESACQARPIPVSRSLFQVLFDVSMKRHGALLILDEPENLARYVIKGIERGTSSALNSLFPHSPNAELLYTIPEARRLVELSSVDGALILDLHGNLLQVGSMILSHPDAPNRFGTRETAAFSAAKNGAIAFKISADGSMSLFFTVRELTNGEVHRFDFW